MQSEAIHNGIKFPSLISGTHQHKDFNVLKTIVKECIENGVTGFDTAPSYKTEKILGQVIRETLTELGKKREDIFISTKIDAWQMQDSDGQVERYLDEVLQEMNLEYIDQLLIHWPIPEYFEKTWKNLIKIHRSGKAKVIGVCNVKERHLNKLSDSEIIPMVVQNERHPMRTDEDALQFCRLANIVYEAYSPVGQMMKPIANSEILKGLAVKHGKSVGQIIMRWQIDTGTIPVFMTTKSDRIKEYASIFSFALSKEDVQAISTLNKDYKIFLESTGCPGF